MLRTRLGVNAREHVAAFVLGSLANGLLLVELTQLSARAGLQANIVQFFLVPQLLMIVLALLVAFAGPLNVRWHWVYVVAGILFAGYAGWRLAFTFTATLELVGPLETKGIPISDYQGSFYALALASAISYVLMILLLRRSYGKLVSNEAVEAGQEVSLHTLG